MTTGLELKAWRTARGLDQDSAGALLGASKRTVIRWEAAGSVPIPEKAARVVAGGDPVSEPAAKGAHEISPPKARGAKAWPPKDGLIYGDAEPPTPAVAANLAKAGVFLTRIERHRAVSPHGSDSLILWGRLAGEPESTDAPILAGKHYLPARAHIGVSTGTPPPRGGQGRRKAA